MPACAISTCENHTRKTKGSEIKYFRFPRNEEFAKKWLAACRRRDQINMKNAVVCSVHFEPECFELSIRHKLMNYKPKNTRGVTPDAVPTLNLTLNKLKRSVPTWKKDADEERALRIAKRRRRNEVNEILKSAAESAIQEELVEAGASCVQAESACLATPQPPPATLRTVNEGQQMEIQIKRKKSCCANLSPGISYTCANATIICDDVEQERQLDQLIEQYDGDIRKLNSKIVGLQEEMETLLKKVEETTDEKCKAIKKYEHILAKRFTLRWSGD